jgi:predicted NBD/HSP70 family sugar kinase
VLIVEVDAAAGFVLAMLTTNETEMAADTDVVLPADRLGLPFPLAVECDLVGALWSTQVERRIGAIDSDTVDAIRAFRQGDPLPEFLGFQGLPIQGSQDPRWRFKVTELAAMQALSAPCTAAMVGMGSVDDATSLTDVIPLGAQTSDLVEAGREEQGPATALGTLLSVEADHGSLSIPEIADATGLPPSTVGRAVSFLLDEGFVVRDRDDQESIRINESRPCAIGVSIRSDELVGVVTNLRAGDLVPAKRRPLPGTDVRIVVQAVAELVTQLLDELAGERQAVTGVGVELSGHIDGRYGEVVYSPDLKAAGDYWRNVYLADQLREATGLPTVIENDANALALHEQWFGDGIGVENFATVLIGDRGIGCGMVVDGGLLHGSEGIAGEVGHLVLEPGGRDCRCDNQGCLETIASPQAICDALAPDGGRPPFDLEGVAQRARDNDPNAVAAFRTAGEALGRGLSMVLNLVNPSHVVLFGPAQLTDPKRAGAPAMLFVDALSQAVERYSFSFAAWQYKLIIKTSDQRLGSKGAASVLLNRMMVRPVSRSPWLAHSGDRP